MTKRLACLATLAMLAVSPAAADCPFRLIGDIATDCVMMPVTLIENSTCRTPRCYYTYDNCNYRCEYKCPKGTHLVYKPVKCKKVYYYYPCTYRSTSCWTIW